jgi:DNA ligase-1
MARSNSPMLASNKGWREDHIEMHLRECGFLNMQPKVDGMRVCFDENVAKSRSWKPHGNAALQMFARKYGNMLQGLDGELVPGHVYTPEVFRTAMSDLRAAGGDENFTIYLFDIWDKPDLIYADRYDRVKDFVRDWNFAEEAPNVKLVACPNYVVRSLREIYVLEERFLADGWEGAIVKRPDRLYKMGRATSLQGHCDKLKRFKDFEALVVGPFEPRYKNNNEAKQNEIGLTSRSSYKDNLEAEECLGAMWCKEILDVWDDLNEENPGQIHYKLGEPFKVGVFRGLTYEDKCDLWKNRESLKGKIAKLKQQDYSGGYDGPRTPVWISWRQPEDL